jgi:nucleoporin NUP159
MVYSIDALSGSGDSKAALEVSTDGQELREVKPNPKLPELVAIVTMGGEVRMLDLNTRSFKTGADGSSVLKTTVCTVAWSKMGKAIVCGMGDGTIWQMKPTGEGMAEVAAPPGVEDHSVSSLLWVENHLFITTHTPSPTGGEVNNESVFHTLDRSKGIVYTKIADPAPPWGMEERSPPYFFTAQLQNYQPNLRNAIIFAGTCATDIGLVARFSEQGNGVPADTFFTAQFSEDTRRAQMPLSAQSTDSSPIGIALDLSAKDNVKRPVGGEEIQESPGPLPIVMVLNYEGMVAAWHVVYNDAIEKGQKYEGMIIYENEQAPPQPQSSTPAKPAASAFGQTSFGSPATASPFATAAASTASPFAAASTGGSAFGKPSFGQPAFGQTSAFGQTAAAPSSGGSLFGQPSTGTSSPWGSASQPPSTPKSSTPSTAFGQLSQLGAGSSAPAFGKPAFGQPAAPAFGAPSQLGAKPAFGQPSSLAASPAAPAFGKPAFGQTGFGSVPASPAPAAGSAFGSGGSGFAAFANKGGFAAVSSQAPAGGSIWGSGKLKTNSTDSAQASVFNTHTKSTGAGGFGSGAIDFKLNTGFKAEPSQAEDNAKPDDSGSLGGFGSMLGGALGGDSTKSAFGGAPAAASSPFATPTKSPFGGLSANKSASPFAAASAFGTTAVSASNPFAPKPTFGAPSPAPSPAPKKAEEPVSPPEEEAPLPPDFTEPKIKELSDEEGEKKIPEAPLPPDTTSRPAYTTGSTTEGTPNLPSSPESSPPASPSPEEAPLPPDFGPEIEEVPELPPALADEEEESEGADDEGEEEEGEESEEGEEESEEEGSEEEGDEEKENQTPKKLTSLFGATPPAKKPTTPGSGSSIFDMQGSLTERGINKNAPFSSLFNKKEEIPSDDEEESGEEDEDESEEEVRPKGRLQRKSPPKGMTRGGAKPISGPKLGVKNDERISNLFSEKKEETTGGLFGSKPTQKLEAPKPPTGLLGGPSEETKAPGGLFSSQPSDKMEAAPKTAGGLFGFDAKPSEKPGAALFSTHSTQVEKKSMFPSTDVASKPAPSIFGSQAPPSPTPSPFGQQGPATGASPFSTAKASPLSKPSTPFTAQPTPPTPEPTKEEPEIEEPESEVDYDAEYSDQEDTKIREQLLNGPLKPCETLPEIQKLVPIDLPEVSHPPHPVTGPVLTLYTGI